MNIWRAKEGSPSPLGCTWIAADAAYNFAVFSSTALQISILLYRSEDLLQPVYRLDLDPLTNKTDDVWHCRIADVQASGAAYYSLHVSSPPEVTGAGKVFQDGKEILDPYAKDVFFPAQFDLGRAVRPGANAGQAVLAVLPPKQSKAFEWGPAPWPLREADLVIYEMHVRGFTRSSSSGVAQERAGTYLGVIDKIPYLKDLGVTAVELMPVFLFEPQGSNYWGYMTMSYFCPHPAYASLPKGVKDEFRTMVKALHEAGIEVILDVVFNHTAEGGKDGPTFSMKALDNPSYYITHGQPPVEFANYSGTGNTLNAATPWMRRLLLDSLRYWVTEMHVDGFRFDLASALARQADGSLNFKTPPVFAEIAADPELADIRMIAEPWDAGDGYLLGRDFPGIHWMQWNGKYRDLVKRFVRGEAGLVGELMTRIYGSDDLFPGDAKGARHPYQSVNYVVSHDGFTLYDTVAYDQKHNQANGENNSDGPSDNLSWNCGFEGDIGVPADVKRLRTQQARNFITILMMSNGTPMFRMGDEFLQTQGGNSNAWNQDNATAWLNWHLLEENKDFYRFVKMLIAFRNAHPSICRSRFWRSDISWYGPRGLVDLSSTSHAVAYILHGASQNDVDVCLMANMYWEDVDFTLQEQGVWLRVIDTSRPSPTDILAPGSEIALPTTFPVCARSVVVAIKV